MIKLSQLIKLKELYAHNLANSFKAIGFNSKVQALKIKKQYTFLHVDENYSVNKIYFSVLNFQGLINAHQTELIENIDIDLLIVEGVTKAYSTELSTSFLSNSSRWGSYNRHVTVDKVIRKQFTNGIYIKYIPTSQIIHHGHKLYFHNVPTEFLTITHKQHGDIDVITSKLKVFNRVVKTEHKAVKGCYEYHTYDGVGAAIKGLKNKIKLINQRAKERVKNKGMVTPAFIKKKFGYCATGISAFINTLGLDNATFTHNEFKTLLTDNANIFKRKLPQYRFEIHQLFNYFGVNNNG